MLQENFVMHDGKIIEDKKIHREETQIEDKKEETDTEK